MPRPLYHIALTGLNATDSPGPGMGVIRSLKAAENFDVKIIGLSYETLEPCIYMRELVSKAYQIPYPSAGMEALYQRLQYILSKERIDVLIPNFDAELFNFIKVSDTLESEFGVKMLLPTADQFESRQKFNLYNYGIKHGIKVPYTKIVFTTSELYTLEQELKFPMVVKGKYYDAQVAQNMEQIWQYFYKISSRWGLPVIIQQYIQGTEVNVCGVGDGCGQLVGAVPMRKLYITDKGKAWAGVSLKDDRLLEITGNFVSSTRWRGPFEMEFIRTPDEEYYLLEINPRFPAWCYLTAGCGQNQPEMLVKLALRQHVPPRLDYEAGKMFIRYSSDMIVNMDDFERISTMGEL
ncbi:MAG: ATP-grasp domain-containing protein [Chitinophagales bacterium]|nr:ATP-grasp domain-containing protein [Chitinophagales bacterium]MDW8419450.1 ATP-grasp domain-containing protein [Chitinophagales bacterium]